MRIYRIEQFGGLDGLMLRTEAEPDPGPNEVVIRVRAMSALVTAYGISARSSVSLQGSD